MQIDHAHASQPTVQPPSSASPSPPVRPCEEPVPVGALIGDVLERLRAALGDEGLLGGASVTSNPNDPIVPIVASARDLYEDAATRSALARGSSYRSVDPAILVAPPGSSKATLFVGDVLTLAGFAVPTHEVRGWDGSLGREYRDAGRWPREGAYFTSVMDLWQVRPGDLVVLHPADGRAQAEVVTDVAFTAGGPVILTMGVREHGLEEDGACGDALCSSIQSDDGFLRRSSGRADLAIHVLRARMPRAARASATAR